MSTSGGCRKKDLQPTSGLDLDSAAAATAPVRFDIDGGRQPCALICAPAVSTCYGDQSQENISVCGARSGKCTSTKGWAKYTYRNRGAKKRRNIREGKKLAKGTGGVVCREGYDNGW